MRDFRYMAIVAVAAAGLALAGCSSSSGVSTSERNAAVAEAEAKKQEQIDMLQAQIATLREALNLDPEGDDDPTVTVADLEKEIKRLNGLVTAQKEAEQMAMEEMADATAAKLHAGIDPQVGTDGSGVSDRFARYNDADTAIMVHIGDGTNADTAGTTLTEDKKTAVAANLGWTGKRYTDAPGGDSVEAVVYSNVEDPKPGKKFGSLTTVPNDNYQYQLVAGSVTVGEDNAALVGGSSFDHSAGTKEFELPANMVAVMLPGTYHGVSGTYSCTPADANTDCSASVAAKGFTLQGGAWMFKPDDANARVMSEVDTSYASYGWWLRKSEDGTYAASAFHDYKGDASSPTGIAALRGTATYVGGAAGKYALYSAIGGRSDAGHFTAVATLEADFGAAELSTISGVIDGFLVGEEEEDRNWSVELKKADIADADGSITGGTTVWTIDGKDPSTPGKWSGDLHETGEDGVPSVVTGTFNSSYSTVGEMVGAFGANKE